MNGHALAITIIMLWTLALLARIIMARYPRGADMAIVFVLCMFTWLAFTSHGHRPPAFPLRQSTVNDQLPIVNDAQPTLEYFASTLDRQRKVYHRAGCQYDRLTTHRVWFADTESAEAQGYEPCRKCVVATVALNP